MTQLRERQAVLYGKDSSLRGIILEIEGVTCTLLGSDMKPHSALLSECSPMPLSLCFRCGREDHLTDEEREEEIRKSDELMTRDFGAPPPPERRMPLCEACATWLYEFDRARSATHGCICAFKDGRAPECVCEGRRSRGFPAP